MKTFSTHLKASPSGFDAIISTPRVDRDGEVVLPSGLKNRDEYLANPLVYWAHEWASNPAAEPIGKATRLDVHNDRIESSAIFAPTAKGRNVEALVKGGFVSRTSIGFSGHVEDVKGVPTFTSWELLEYSVVPMPANVDAAITGVKSALVWLADAFGDDESVDTAALITIAEANDLVIEPIPNGVRLREAGLVIAAFAPTKRYRASIRRI